MSTAESTSGKPIGIIGAGFAGIITALALLKSGRKNFIIFEKAQAIGGTWRDNTYPGCACDVPSVLYSISDEPNPNWSRFFSPQPEILAYMQAVVQKHGLEAHIQYGAEIVHSAFDETDGSWELTDRQGRKTSVKALIAATGPLNRIKLPDIPGRDTFQGKAFHTAAWDTSYDFQGKRIAVIGTGASAIQVVPALAPVVGKLIVFQRTAAWISPRNDRAIPAAIQRRFARFPRLQRLIRNLIYSVMEFRGKLFLGNRFVHNFSTKQSLKKLAREVKDPETRRKLTPDYKLGCKRILTSDDYLPAFNRDNVQLVTDPISEINATGLRTKDGRQYDVDAILYSTGFEASELHTDAKLYGRNGRELFSEWEKKGMEAHRGTTFSGFPNLMYVLGPNTGLGHSSVLHIMESQMPYILQYLDLLDRQGPNGFLDVKSAAQTNYNSHLQARFRGTVWESGCKSWYLNSQGKNTTLYPRLTRAFRKQMAKLDTHSYQTL